MNRERGFGVEIRDVLLDAVLEDLKVVLAQSPDKPAFRRSGADRQEDLVDIYAYPVAGSLIRRGWSGLLGGLLLGRLHASQKGQQNSKIRKHIVDYSKGGRGEGAKGRR